MPTAWDVESEQNLDTGTQTPQLRVVVPPATPASENNNPGNLEYRGQDGATKNGRWAQFAKPEDGYAALQDQIDIDAKRGSTLGDYIAKYAPKKENDTETYTRNAEAATGAPRDTPLARVDRDKLAAFQAKQESGTNVWDVAGESPLTGWEVDKETPLSAPAPVATSTQGVIPGMEKLGNQPPGMPGAPIPAVLRGGQNPPQLQAPSPTAQPVPAPVRPWSPSPQPAASPTPPAPNRPAPVAAPPPQTPVPGMAQLGGAAPAAGQAPTIPALVQQQHQHIIGSLGQFQPGAPETAPAPTSEQQGYDPQFANTVSKIWNGSYLRDKITSAIDPKTEALLPPDVQVAIEVAKVASGVLSPENAAVALGAGEGGALLKLGANSTKMAALVANSPRVAKLVDILSNSGISGGFTGITGWQSVQNAKQAWQAYSAGDLDAAKQHAIDAAVSVVFAGMGAAGIKTEVEATRAAYPPEQSTVPGRRLRPIEQQLGEATGIEPSARATKLAIPPEEAAATATALQQSGKTLVAQAWQKLAKGAQTDPISVDIDGQPHTVQELGRQPTGRKFYQVLNPDGKPIYGGTGGAVQDFLQQRGATPINEGTGTTPAIAKPAVAEARVIPAPEKPWPDMTAEEKDAWAERVAKGSGGAANVPPGEAKPADADDVASAIAWANDIHQLGTRVTAAQENLAENGPGWTDAQRAGHTDALQNNTGTLHAEIDKFENEVGPIRDWLKIAGVPTPDAVEWQPATETQSQPEYKPGSEFQAGARKYTVKSIGDEADPKVTYTLEGLTQKPVTMTKPLSVFQQIVAPKVAQPAGQTGGQTGGQQGAQPAAQAPAQLTATAEKPAEQTGAQESGEQGAQPEAQTTGKGGSETAVHPRYQEMVDAVRDAGKASTSTLQRKFKLGYGAASQVLDQMEKDGIVGPADGSKPREILNPAAPQQALAKPKDQQTEDIITGTLNPPLSAQGQADARTRAEDTQDATEINAGPMARTQESAELASQAARVPVATKTAFQPWDLGQFQGKPQSEVDDQINHYIAHPDEVVPGGVSYNTYKDPLIGEILKQRDEFQPGQRILNVTHSIGVQTVQAWIANGAHPDKSINVDAMLKRQKLQPTSLLRIDPRTMQASFVDDMKQDGIYLERHADTPLDNIQPGSSVRTGTRTKPAVSLPSPSLPSEAAEPQVVAPEAHGGFTGDLFRGTETGTQGRELRESAVGELGRGAYATPHKWLAATYGGGPSANVRKGTREVHKIELKQALEPKEVAYLDGGANGQADAVLRDGAGQELWRGRITGKKTDRPLIDAMNDAARKHGAKLIIGGPDSLALNQAVLLDPSVGKKPIKLSADEALAREAPASTVAATPGPQQKETAAEKPPGEIHKFASTQVNLPEGIANKTREWATRIPEKALAEDGREAQPHVTVKYGLHDDDPAAAINALAGEGPIKITFGAISLFKGKTPEDPDVLKVDIKSPDLHRLNGKIAGLPHTDTFPKYRPHLTLAYVKRGTGDKYAGKIVPGVSGKTITLDTVSFRARDEKNTDIPLTKAKAEEKPAVSTPAPALPSAKAPIKISAKSKYAAEVARRRDFYTPGNIIHVDYWNSYDKVLAYAEKPDGEWSVTVQRTNKEGIPVPGAEIRTHATSPDKNDKIVARETPVGEQEPATAPEPERQKARKPESQNPPVIDADSRYADEENPTALLDAAREQYAQWKQAEANYAEQLLNPKLKELRREAIEGQLATAGKMASASLAEIANAFGQETAATIEAEHAQNGPNARAGENPSALEEVPSENVPSPGEEREAGAGVEKRRRTDEGSLRPGDRTGTSAGPGEGTDEGAVGVPAGREADARTRTGTRNSPESRLGSGTDYRITDADHIGEGSVKEKASQNLDAIRTLKQIEQDGRIATPDEQKILAKYVGWGGMPQPFQETYAVPREWEGVRADLNGLLTPEEFASARASTPNAHFTSPTVIKGMWDAAERLGLLPKDGQVTLLEPSMGVGSFFGLMPEGAEAQRVGVELDSITGRISKLLYPNADVHVAGFEKVRLPNDYFDLAISNVPFGNYPVFDTQYKRTPGVTRSIHDYFFAKALDKVRPGGVVAFITSSYTMDKQDPFMRDYLAQRANLIGAIRLPNTAFKASAGTEVTTDIIFLQKRAPDSPAAGEPWSELKAITGERQRPDGSMGPVQMQVNEYYAAHPEMMLGKMGLLGSMYRNETPALTGNLTSENLAAAIARLPENIVQGWQAPVEAFESVSSIPASGELKDGAYTLQDGKVLVRNGDQLRPTTLSSEQIRRVSGQIKVRDAVHDVFRTQLSGDSEPAIAEAMKKLNAAYDAFVRNNGPLHKKENAKAFADDPDAPVLLALEDWDKETQKAKKADIFSKRVIDTSKPATSADNAKDALGLSLNEKGRLDWARMQELTGRTPRELQDELGPLVYQDPSGKMWQPADEYLSGNVRRKLADAEAAARVNRAFQRNVEALKAVQPKELLPGEIKARLGSSWIPKQEIQKFVSELLDIPLRHVSVGHSEGLGSWSLSLAQKDTVANNRTWGTNRFRGSDLIDDALNLRSPTVYDTIGSGADAKRVINDKETLAAREMQKQIKDKFSEWAWADTDRATRLAQIYNEELNSDRLWQPDGSHLTLPGLALGLNLRPHQKNVIWRIVRGDGNVLMAHTVGAGKTLGMIGGAMELRRLGKSKKPMIVVPNNRVGGTAEEWLRAYPSANILTVGGEDFTPDQRQQMMARIATGNWDGVIVSYEAFTKVPVSDETFNGFLREQIDEYEGFIREAKSDINTKIVKELEKAKKRMEAKVRGKNDDVRRDRAISFEDLGVDSLFVDEADCLPYDTPVLTDKGVLPIGLIVEAKLPVLVHSVNSENNTVEWKPVTDWFWNPITEPLLRVFHENGYFDCTARHRIWTDRGYVAAQSLSPGDELRLLPNIIYSDDSRKTRTGAEMLLPQVCGRALEGENSGNETVSAMWERFHFPVQRREEQYEAPILRESLRCDVEERPARANRAIQNLDRAILGMHKREQAAGYGGTPARPESQIPNSRIIGEAGSQAEGPYFFEPRRKWPADQPAIVVSRPPGFSDGIPYYYRPGETPLPECPELLQGRFGSSPVQDSDRSGRADSRFAEVEIPRPAQNRNPVRSRVVRVEVQERDCNVIAGLSGDHNHRVYCLEVQDNHNFFAAGVLVSNSFKNLQFPSKMQRISGIPNTESQRAFDMYLKTQYLTQRNNGRGVVFATGTPVANSMAEVWTMQRYLQPQYLKEHGLQHFDSWAQTFGEVNPALEMTPDGTGVRVTNKFNKFVNMPELMRGFRQMADVQTAKMLNLPVPKLKGDRPTIVSAKASPAQQEYLKQLAERAKSVKGKKPQKGADNILVIGTDGQKAAVDIRLVDPSQPDHPESKVNMAVDRIADTWKKTEANKSTQIVFLDMSTPQPKSKGKAQGFSVYEDMRDKLIRRGIPKAEIAFIQDYKGDEAKEDLFAAMNSGKVRVLFGSTQAAGVGVNVQKKLVAQHQLDAPYRPRDVEQREGRILRQGNENKEIEILRYVTEPSFDARKWDILTGKASYINAFMEGDMSVREMEDISDAELSYGEIAAIASGNPAIREKVLVDTEIRKLDAMRSRFEQQEYSIKRDLQALPGSIKSDHVEQAKAQKDIDTRDAAPNEFTIGKKTFKGEDGRKNASIALETLLNTRFAEKGTEFGSQTFPIGSYRGFKLSGIDYTATDGVRREADILIHGALTYKSTNPNPGTAIQSIEGKIRNIEAVRDNWARSAADSEKKLADTKKIAGQSFEQGDKLKKLLARQAELEKILQTKEPDASAVGGDSDEATTGAESVAPAEGTEAPDTPQDVQEAKKQDLAASIHGAANGPISAYKPGRGNLKAPERAGGSLKEGWLTAEDEGRPIYSDGHILLEGAAPGAVTDTSPVFAKSMREFLHPATAPAPVSPVAFGAPAEKGAAKTVWFSDGTAVDAKYYDHVVKQYPSATFAAGKAGKSGPVIYVQFDGRNIGIVMPLKFPTGAPDAVKPFLKPPDEGSQADARDAAQARAEGGERGSFSEQNAHEKRARLEKAIALAEALDAVRATPAQAREMTDAQWKMTADLATGLAREENPDAPIVHPPNSQATKNEVAGHLKLIQGIRRNAGERGAAPMLGDLNQHLIDKFGPEAPRANLSGLGAFERIFLPGKQLAEVQRASKPLFRAALRAAGSESYAATLLRASAPAIRAALRGSDHTWEELELYYVESRLRGLRDRWNNFAQQAEQMTPEEMVDAMKESPDGSGSAFLGLLGNIEGRQGLAQDLGQTAMALAQAGDFDNLGKFLAQTFRDASSRVATAMDPVEFDDTHNAVQSDPKMKEADRLYGELLEQPMAESHSLNEGVFSDSLGPAGRYFPLMAVGREPGSPAGRRLAYRKPKNQNNAFATGLSESYDISMDAFAQRLSGAIRGNNKAALIEALKASRWAVPEGQTWDNENGQMVMRGPDGNEYLAVREESSPGRTLIQGRKITRIPAHFIVMPKFVNRALKPILAREPMDPNSVIALMRWANNLATKGPLELIFHTNGVMGALYANTPFLGDSLPAKVLSAPIAKWFDIRRRMYGDLIGGKLGLYKDPLNPSDPDNVKKLLEMSKAGALPAKSGKITYSKEYAEETGAKLERLSFGPLLYGPHGIDARARILMYDIWKAAYPKGDLESLHHFVNQIGNYIPELQGEIEKWLKHVGLGPFATAGMTRVVNGIHTFTGSGPGPGGTWKSRLQWWLTASAAAAIAVWVIAYKELTGKWPLHDKLAKVFEIPVQAGHGIIGQFRHSKLGDARWGKNSNPGYLDFGFFDNPLAMRGSRALGLRGAAETLNLGGNGGQASEAAEADVLNTLSGPALGPAARAAFVGITGDQPYVTGFRDYRTARAGLSMMPAVPPKTKPGWPTAGARALAAAKQLNSLGAEAGENLGALTGLYTADQELPKGAGNWWLRSLLDLAAPGLFANSSNPAGKAAALKQQQRALGIR